MKQRIMISVVTLYIVSPLFAAAPQRNIHINKEKLDALTKEIDKINNDVEEITLRFHPAPAPSTKSARTTEQEITEYLANYTSNAPSPSISEKKACYDDSQKFLADDITRLLSDTASVRLCSYLDCNHVAAHAQQWNTVLQKSKIHCLSAELHPHPGQIHYIYILYSPSGKTNAYLLLKHCIRVPEAHHQNHYLISKIVGNSRESIYRYYATHHESGRKNLAQHREDARAWIKQHSDNLDEWVHNNAQQYVIVDRLGF